MFTMGGSTGALDVVIEALDDVADARVAKVLDLEVGDAVLYLGLLLKKDVSFTGQPNIITYTSSPPALGKVK